MDVGFGQGCSRLLTYARPRFRQAVSHGCSSSTLLRRPANSDALDVYYHQEDDEGDFTFKLNNDNVTEPVAAFNLNWSHFSSDTRLSNTLGYDCRLSLTGFRSLRKIRKTADSLQHHERRRRS